MPVKKHSEESKLKISKATKGRTAWNKGLACPELGQHNKGKVYTVEEKQKLSNSHLGQVISDSTKEKIGNSNSEKHKIETSTGEILDIFNLRKFCKENKLSQPNLCTYGTDKGYKLLETTKKIRTYTLTNLDTKEVFKATNLAEFCRPLGISNAGLYKKYTQNKPYRNWKLEKIEISELVVKKSAS